MAVKDEDLRAIREALSKIEEELQSRISLTPESALTLHSILKAAQWLSTGKTVAKWIITGVITTGAVVAAAKQVLEWMKT